MPSVTLIRSTRDGDKLAGQAAAICTNSFDWQRALGHSLKSGHESVIEHVSFTFLIEDVSRSLLAQLSRHRIATLSVESQRYVDMGDMFVVIPKTIQDRPALMDRYMNLMGEIREFYRDAVHEGVPKEDARYVTPQAAKTRLFLTMNARELKHFFSLRCCNRAQWEIRALADEMLRICQKECPRIFANAGPGCVRDRCPESRPCGNPRNDLKRSET